MKLAQFLLTSSAIALLPLYGCGDSTDPTDGPTIGSFQASKAAVARGERVNLSWSVQNATKVSITAAPGGTVLEASTELTGSVESAAIDASTTFTLKAENANGSTTKEVSVTLDANAVAVISFTANPNPGRLNGVSTLQWITAGANQVRILRGSEVITTETTNVASGTFDVTLAQASTTYTLEARNDSAVDTRTLTVTAEAAPVIDTFTVAPAFFTGASAEVTITWATQNATTLTLTANGTAVAGFSAAASGTMTQNVTESTVFVLSASSGGGSAQQTRSVAQTIAEVEPNDDIASAVNLGAGGGVEGALEPSSDVDFYSVTVPAGYSLYAETSDGQGGCATDTVLTLYNAAEEELTSDDDSGAEAPSGSGACSIIDPASDLAAAELAAGTYYIRVSGFEAGPYHLLVRLIAPGCGNTVWEAGRNEQCDDGNLLDGDGCSATCELEVEGMISGPPGTQVFSGTAEALNYSLYVLEVTTDAYVDAQLFAPSMPTCPADDAEIAIFNSSGAEVTFAAGGSGECPHVDPNEDSAAFLEAGTYFLGVGFYGTDGQTFPYQVEIKLLEADICGNGVFEDNEQCDDGNTTPGDGCSATCRIEPVGTLSGPPASQTFSGTAPGGRLQFYEVTLTAEAYIEAAVFTPTAPNCTANADPVIYVADADLNTMDFDDDSGPELCAHSQPAFATDPRLPPGQYFVATGFRGDETQSFPYELRVTVRAVDICGNGVAETNEQCDDGNTDANDGCSATCQLEIAATINPPSGVANLNLPSNIAYQTVRVNVTQAGQTITATTTSGASCDSDNALELYEADLVTLRGRKTFGAANDCAEITVDDAFARNLPTGAYYLVVRPEGGQTGPLTLRVTILNPACGNGRIESRANEACDDGNTANGDGCSSTCQFEGNVLLEVEPNSDIAGAQASGAVTATTRTIAGSIDPVADVDFYAFTVPAGATRALVARTYSNVGDPTSCTGIDTRLALYDSAGTEITSNDDTSIPTSSVCSEISEASTPGVGVNALAPGTYYLEVGHWIDSRILPQYFLDIRFD